MGVCWCNADKDPDIPFAPCKCDKARAARKEGRKFKKAQKKAQKEAKEEELKRTQFRAAFYNAFGDDSVTYDGQSWMVTIRDFGGVPK